MIETEKTVASKMNMPEFPPVCILTAGQGTRMGPYAEIVNKALLPVGDKAAISLIIERFPQGTEFVIALGYLADQVKTYLEMAHPEVSFKFCNVENFSGPGSGPGLSLLSCKNELQRPFYFLSCDTLCEGEMPGLDQNWVAVSSVEEQESHEYCNFQITGLQVQAIRDKENVDSKNHKAFTGFMFIKDHSQFWEGLEDQSLVAGEHQVSNGLQRLIDQSGLRASELKWTDLGTLERYKEYVSTFHEYDFSKTNEFLYFTDKSVIKFFADTDISAKRVEKAHIKPDVFPQVSPAAHGFYKYDYVKGETMYSALSEDIFVKLLNWLEEKVWARKASDDDLKDRCKIFYKEKTQKRIDLYFQKMQFEDSESKVNGVSLPTTSILMNDIDWKGLCNGEASFMHGDLQFDNILFDEESDSFTLLDWRQDFAGLVSHGDIYYDLSKMYGGILLNYDLIKKNQFSYTENGSEISLHHEPRPVCEKVLKRYEEFIVSEGYDLKKVKTLVGLIYLNMAPLHHGPFDKFLYSLGRLKLHEALSS